MGRKKYTGTPNIFHPRPDEFIPDHPPSGVCLLCDEWLGINCEEQDKSKGPAPKHIHKSGVLFTPHIIVSPDDNPPYCSDDEDNGSEEKENSQVDPPVKKTIPTVKESDEIKENRSQDSPESERSFNFADDISIDGILLEEQTKSTENINESSIVKVTPNNDEIVQIDDNNLRFYDNQQKRKSEPMSNYQGHIDNTKHLQTVRNENARESLLLCLSALYGKLLVVMGMAFPIAENISSDVPLVFYNVFYLFLYFGSISFLVYAYLFLLRAKPLPMVSITNNFQNLKSSMTNLDVKLPEIPIPDSLRQFISKKKENKENPGNDEASVANSVYKVPKYSLTESSNHGSMYLKMGAVVFGIGSMIYSGLEFGQYFEIIPDTECGNIIMAVTPVSRMIFTFLQMYFIFLNSRVAISKNTNIARFGLMHMIATNLCIWQSVLVEETKHEIAHLVQRAANMAAGSSQAILGNHLAATSELSTQINTISLPVEDALHHEITRREINFDGTHTCRRGNLMGAIVNSASPFLFPCTIEYSLLCAGVLYVMWKNINALKAEKSSPDADSDISNFIARKVRHHYSVDCSRASRGLFIGIFIMVLTIISLILFYVLISNENYRTWAIMEANIIEVTIYSLATISLLIGMKQMRQLEFIPDGDIELDNILLLIAQAGVYIYTSFTIIGGLFSIQDSPILPLITAILTLIQTTLQTIFILDGSRRCCYTAEQHDRKPGREMVTFLLVCNLAMWAISTFETSRADAHPVQMEFYGIWAWTIISHVSMPLAIFYRFHVTVCLGEIWKRAYKVKQEFYALS